MRCAFIVPALANKGPIIVVYELVKGLIKLGIQCTVFYFDENVELFFPCMTERISMKNKINFSQYDIIHSHGFRPDIYIFIHKPMKKTQTFFLSTIHCFMKNDFKSSYNNYSASLLEKIWTCLLYRHDRVIVLSKVAMEYYAHHIRREKIRCIYNTRSIDSNNSNIIEDDHIYAQILRFKATCKYTLGINAMLSPVKGIDIALRALPLLDNIKLIVIGDGQSMSYLQQLSIELGITDKVFWGGYQKEAHRFLKYYDLYLMPSRSEGFPLALLEAISMHKNIVISDIPIFKEIFTEKEATFFQRDNVKSLVNAIKYALKNDKSTEAYSRYLQDYSPDCFIQSHLNVYQEMIN